MARNFVLLTLICVISVNAREEHQPQLDPVQPGLEEAEFSPEIKRVYKNPHPYPQGYGDEYGMAAGYPYQMATSSYSPAPIYQGTYGSYPAPAVYGGYSEMEPSHSYGPTYGGSYYTAPSYTPSYASGYSSAPPVYSTAGSSKSYNTPTYAAIPVVVASSYSSGSYAPSSYAVKSYQPSHYVPVKTYYAAPKPAPISYVAYSAPAPKPYVPSYATPSYSSGYSYAPKPAPISYVAYSAPAPKTYVPSYATPSYSSSYSYAPKPAPIYMESPAYSAPAPKTYVPSYATPSYSSGYSSAAPVYHGGGNYGSAPVSYSGGSQSYEKPQQPVTYVQCVGTTSYPMHEYSTHVPFKCMDLTIGTKHSYILKSFYSPAPVKHTQYAAPAPSYQSYQPY